MFQRKEIATFLTTVLLSYLLTAIPVNAQSVSFTARRDFPSEGRQPESIVTGDFNRDGKPDLAIFSLFQSTVAIYNGNGDGHFQHGVDIVYPIEKSIGTNAVATDLEMDGKLDLVSSGHIVLRGNGDGTFQMMPDVDVLGISDVSAADLNGDGHVDLAFAHGFSMRIEVAAGNGDGTFQPAMRYGSGGLPNSIATGDFNGDGKPDLVTTNSASAGAGSDKISLLFNRQPLGRARRPLLDAASLSLGP